MTLKLKGDLHILKMDLYTENEAASLNHSNCLKVKGQGQNVKSSELLRA